jgi:hypothetical protein
VSPFGSVGPKWPSTTPNARERELKSGAKLFRRKSASAASTLDFSSRGGDDLESKASIGPTHRKVAAATLSSTITMSVVARTTGGVILKTTNVDPGLRRDDDLGAARVHR